MAMAQYRPTAGPAARPWRGTAGPIPWLFVLALSWGGSIASAAATPVDESYAPPPRPELESSDEKIGEVREAPGGIGHVSLLVGETRWFAQSASSDGWIRAQPNLPIVANSSLATADGARAEVRVGTTTIALDGNSQADFLDVGDHGLVVRVAHGRVAVATTAFAPQYPIELRSRGTSVIVRSDGRYALGFGPRAAGGASIALAQVHEGQADLRLGVANLPLYAGQEARIDTSGPLSQDRRQIIANDFDRWVEERARHWEETIALADTGDDLPEMPPVAEQVTPGGWQEDPGHGAAWGPRDAEPSWLPYDNGQWETVAPVGQVWIAPAPAAPARPMVPQPQPGQWIGRPPPRAWQPHPPPYPPGHPPHHQPRPPRFDPGPGGFPNPPRAYPTPPRQYPSPMRPWPPQR